MILSSQLLNFSYFMLQPHITLLSFGHFERNFLEKIANHVSREFDGITKIREAHFDLSDFYEPSRNQYNGNLLIKEIDTKFAADDTKTLALFAIDLFIPILTYIFGQAYLKGRTGIASTHRLSNERYGIKPDEKLLQERFTKEIIHELGHTFGLIHCHITTCVMRSSTYVEDIDQKDAKLCAKCKEEMAKLAIIESVTP